MLFSHLKMLFSHLEMKYSQLEIEYSKHEMKYYSQLKMDSRTEDGFYVETDFIQLKVGTLSLVPDS